MDAARLGQKVWEELCVISDDPSMSEQKGTALFERFLMYTLGLCGLPFAMHEVLGWLVASAFNGYCAAFITGPRVFAAHDMAVPAVIEDGPKCKQLRDDLAVLESLPSDENYSNAVRLFWTKELRALIPKLLPIPQSSDTSTKLSDITASRTKMGDQQFRKYAEKGFLLHHAVLQNDIKGVELLLQYGCDVNLKTQNGLTPLQLASRTARISLIHRLWHTKPTHP